MHAAYLTGHGGNEVVALGDRPQPARGPGQVRVRIKAATLNRVDLYMRDSGAGITHSLPQIMGVDGAGVVEEANDGAFTPGQRVVLYPAVTCGRCEFCRRGEQMLCLTVSYLGEHRDGTLCEQVVVPEANVLPLPDGLDFAEGAALGVAYLTAWRMVFSKAGVRPWETVLIFGLGGVSLAALQLVKLAGARAVVTSRDAAKLDAARRLGADHVIDTSKEDVVRRVMQITEGRGVDVVIENVGQAVWPSALKSLVRQGRIVTCGATSGDAPSADLRRLFVRQLQVFGSTLGSQGEFADLIAATATGALKPVIGARYPLDRLHEALDRLETGEVFGKIAIDI